MNLFLEINKSVLSSEGHNWWPDVVKTIDWPITSWTHYSVSQAALYGFTFKKISILFYPNVSCVKFAFNITDFDSMHYKELLIKSSWRFDTPLVIFHSFFFGQDASCLQTVKMFTPLNVNSPVCFFYVLLSFVFLQLAFLFTNVFLYVSFHSVIIYIV